MASRPGRGELMHCHSCRNEFYKTGASIACPECQSEFTEIVDDDFEDDMEPDDGPFPHPAMRNDIGGMLQTIMGFDAMGASRDGPGQGDVPQWSRIPPWSPQPYDGGGRSPYSPHFPQVSNELSQRTRPSQPARTPSHGQTTGFTGFGSWPPGPSSHNTPRSQTRTTYDNNGGVRFQWSFSSSSGPRGGHVMEGPDLNDMFMNLLGPSSGARGPGGGGPNPLADIFGALFAGNGRMGDTVLTQEAFDQVMSQLMEQHTSGSAPGPASEVAIQALPRKKVTDDMLDENTKQAECAICMDNVTVGEEVAELPCRHWFHHPCVEAWLKEHDTCPVCRSGITPKDGPDDTVRTPEQAPLHDEGPATVSRRQSGARDHPFVVPESPTASRRRPNPRRHSSNGSGPVDDTGSGSTGGITGRVRSFFSGGGGTGSGNNNGQGSSSGRRW